MDINLEPFNTAASEMSQDPETAVGVNTSSEPPLENKDKQKMEITSVTEGADILMEEPVCNDY